MEGNSVSANNLDNGHDQSLNGSPGGGDVMEDAAYQQEIEQKNKSLADVKRRRKE